MAVPGSDVLVVGGGLIGTAIGWRLAKAGAGVAVLERDPAGTGRPTAAGWAAAGMLAPVSEAGFREPELLALGRHSLAMYPEWVAELEEEAGMGVDLRTEGTLLVALDADDAARLRRLHEFQQSLGLPTAWLGGAEAREREPALAPGVVGAVDAPADHGVDNRLLLTALRRALVAAGGELREGVEALRVLHDGGRVTGVRIREGGEEREIAADRVVVAAGAWTRLLLGEGLAPEELPPIRPVKGQLLALGMEPLFELRMTIRTPRVYLVPKSDGRLVVGATSEEAGFDTRLTAGGVLELLRDAWETVPGIYELPLLESWAGLRPGSRDNAPLIGPTGIDGLFLAGGHGRNGVLLTPVTADAMAELLRTGRVPDAIRPFAPDRFRPRTPAR